MSAIDLTSLMQNYWNGVVPVPVEHLLHCAGVDFSKQKDLNGVMHIGRNNGQKYIIIRAGEDSMRVRYAMAYALAYLGKYELTGTVVVDLNDFSVKNNKTSVLNYQAGAILIPKSALEFYLKKGWRAKTLEELAITFKVSGVAMQHRLKALGITSDI